MKVNEDFIKEKVGDECVLVPTGDTHKNGIFNLNETAERIFDLLSEDKGRNEIVAILCGEYETDKKTAEKYTDDYIAELLKAGILRND